jgi:hypothetical protein
MIALFDAHADRCQDGTELWGGDLCVPLLLADPDTRAVFAASADPQNVMTRDGHLYRGELPIEINIANTSVDWAGQAWAMVMLPIPADADAALAVALHESFHARQAEFGLPSDGGAVAHLETLDGRTWLRMEISALIAALRREGHVREGAIASVLAFRAERWRLIEGAEAAEIPLEDHEGLAQYTGDVLAYGDEAAERVAADIERALGGDASYARSYAYSTGPAYGLLLDEFDPGWRERFVPGTGLPNLLSEAMGWGPVGQQFVQQVEHERDAFGYQTIAAEESIREAARIEEDAELTARFVDGATLTIPLRQMQFSFDPSEVRPLSGPDGEIGSIYPSAVVSDDWGRIEVTDGALIYSTWDRMSVPLSHQMTQVDGELRAAGWSLTLAEGWEIDQDGMKWRLTGPAAAY